VGRTVRHRKPILTPHQQKEARTRVQAGEPRRSVARSYNVSQATISRLARTNETPVWYA
jgi:DNA invertase Pin-like site-specific DNA recombinase